MANNEALAVFLRSQGLTLAEIGSRMGCSRQRVYQLLNPVKTKARAAVAAALARGDIRRPEACEGCNTVPNYTLDAHHHDYSRPLDILWLCRPCHGRTWRRYTPPPLTTEPPPPLSREFFATTGRRGGQAGTGGAKVRGDKDYYVRLGKLAAERRWKRANGSRDGASD